MKIRLDPDALSFGDMIDFEEAAGVGLMDTFGKIEKAGDMAGLSMKVLAALVWVCGRQDDPGLTLEGVRKLRLTELEIDVGGNGADPTPGGD